MRLALFMLGLSLALPGGARGHDERHAVSFHAPPCFELCVPGAGGYRWCGNPFPSGGYEDVITEQAPDLPEGKTKVLLEFEIYPVMDWDAIVCPYPDTPPMYTGCIAIGGPYRCGQKYELSCPEPIPQLTTQLGCSERIRVFVKPGKRYTLRAYNWLDAFDCPGSYIWTFL